MMHLRYPDVRESLPSKVQVTLGIFTNDGFFMVTSHIVPFDTVTVEVVQNSQTSLIFTSLLNLFTVVRLASGGVESSSERPIVEGSAISGVKPGLIGGPEPSVDFLGEEVGTIATIKVAQTARCPDVLHATHPLFDPFVFVLGFEADQIHASFSAVVSSVEPIPVGTSDGRVAGSPGEEVVVPSVVLNATIVQSVSAELAVRKAQFSSPFARISTTIRRKQLIFASGHGTLRSIITKPRSAKQIKSSTASSRSAKEVTNGVKKLSLRTL